MRLPRNLLLFSVSSVLLATTPVFAQDDNAQEQADASPDQNAPDPGASGVSADLSFGSVLHGIGDAAGDAYDFAKHGVEDAESVGKEVGDNISDAAKKGLQAIKGLLDPCKTCERAMSAGIENFTCSQTAKALVGQTEECAASVSEEAPEFAEYAEPICVGVRAGIKMACKKMLHEKNIHKAESKIVDSACHHVGLCK